MPRVTLTTRNVTTLRARAAQTDYFDKGLPGFHLRVGSGGSRTYFVKYRDKAGRQWRDRIGDATTMKLANARKTAKAKLGDVAKGKSPAQEKAERRAAPSVRDLAGVYLREHASRKRSGERDRAILDRDVLPEIGDMKAGKIRRGDIKSLLKKIAERPAPVLANRAHEVLRKMYNFALDEEEEFGFGVEHNPCLRITREPEPRRTRWLTLKEIKALWKALDHESADAAGAIKLLLLTGQRQGNVLAMRWADVDFAERLWLIPADATKTGEAYEVPLSGAAIWILAGLRGRDDTWVFPMRGKDEPACRTFMSKPFASAMKRAKIKDFRLHDARHTLASHLGHMGFDERIIGKVLHHRERSTTSRYVHATYRREKTAAIEAWAERVLEAVYAKPATGKVVKLRAAQ